MNGMFRIMGCYGRYYGAATFYSSSFNVRLRKNVPNGGTRSEIVTTHSISLSVVSGCQEQGELSKREQDGPQIRRCHASLKSQCKRH